MSDEDSIPVELSVRLSLVDEKRKQERKEVGLVPGLCLGDRLEGKKRQIDLQSN